MFELLKRNLPAAVLTLVWIVTAPGARGDDWPHAFGPARTSASAERGLNFAWPEAGPPRLWLRHDLGVGYSGPAVVGDRVYLLSGRERSEFLLCLDLHTGNELWATPVGELYENDYGDGPRATPTVFGNRAYAIGGRGTLACVQADTGQKHWEFSLVAAGGELPGWGYSESPLADDRQVVCIPGAAGGVVALDAATGALRWRCRDWIDAAQYTSLSPVSIDGEWQYVALSRERIGGIAADAGQLRWQAPFVSSVVVTTSPLVADGQILASAGGGTGSEAWRLLGRTEIESVYANKITKSLANGLCLYEAHLYGYSEGRGWVCQEFASGRQAWTTKAFERGSVLAVDGKLICLSEDAGLIALAEATPEAWRELRRFTLAPQSQLRKPSGRIWTQPVLSQGRLLIRDQEVLHCFDLRPAAEAK